MSDEQLKEQLEALAKAKDKRTEEVLGELSFILEDCGAQVEIMTTRIQKKVFCPSAIISNAAENLRLINPTPDYEKVAEIGDDTEEVENALVDLGKISVLAIKNKELVEEELELDTSAPSEFVEVESTTATATTSSTTATYTTTTTTTKQQRINKYLENIHAERHGDDYFLMELQDKYREIFKLGEYMTATMSTKATGAGTSFLTEVDLEEYDIEPEII